MPDYLSVQVTVLLEAICRGESPAAAELMPLVYDELRRLVGREMAKERRGHTLQPTLSSIGVADGEKPRVTESTP